MAFEIISRSKWGAVKPLSKKSLPHPVPYIRTVPLSDATPCKTLEECLKSVKEIQHKDMTDGKQQDIKANFLIGDDGRVYEGRGWFSEPPPHRVNHFCGEFLEIGHIGGKGDVPPTPDFMKAKKDLLEYGVRKKFINKYHSAI